MRKLQKMLSLDADLENSERGGWDTCPHASYIDTFLFFWKVYKNNTEFQKKRGGRSPPLNLPLITKNNQWLPVLHNMETKSHGNHLQYTELFITTAIFFFFFPQEHFNVLVQIIRHTFYFDCNHCQGLTSHRLLSLYRNEAFQWYAIRLFMLGVQFSPYCCVIKCVLSWCFYFAGKKKIPREIPAMFDFLL